MKIIFAFVIGSLIWSPTVIAQDKSTRDQAGLSGPVKTVEVYIVAIAMNEGKLEQGKRRPWYRTTYKPEGNIVEQFSYDHLGDTAEKLVYA